MAHSAAQTRIRVVAAAVFDPGAGEGGDAAAGADGAGGSGRRVLIAQRPPGKHMAGRWEFPGGKVASGESDLEALRRELHEELGIDVAAAKHCLTLTHAYSDRTVELSMWIVDRYRGEPTALDGQQIKWVSVGELCAEDILEADRPFIEALQAGESLPVSKALGADEAPGAGESGPS